jgi:tetratricopeptide (TPR) repeat protein
MKRHWILGLSLLLLLGAGGATALLMSNRRPVTTSSQAAYEAYQEARANANRFYFKEARLGFARALELDPHFAMAMLGLAGRSPDEEQRVALVRRAARERSRLTERERLHLDLALAMVEKRNADYFDIARALHAKFPDDVEAASILCMEQIQLGNRDQAIKIFEELLAVDPNNAEAYNQIGYYWGYRGDYEKAVDNLKKYQFIAADTANPFDSLGEVQAYSGHYAEAVENLNHALAIKPDFSPAYQHLGVVHEGTGDWAKAIENYRRAEDFVDKDGERRNLESMALRAALIGKDPAAARISIERLSRIPVEKNDPYSPLHQGYVETLGDLVDGRAAQVEQRLTALRPKLEETFAQTQKAGKILPTIKPHFREWNLLMALALEKQGRTDEALKLYEENANPPNPFQDFDSRRWIMEARAKVAEIVARKGDLDRAEKLLAENRKWNASWAPCRASEEIVAQLRRERVLAAAR